MTISPYARRLSTFAIVTSLALTVGCARGRRGTNVQPQFGAGTRTQKPMAADPLSGADQPGALYDNVRLDLIPAETRSRAGGRGCVGGGGGGGGATPPVVEGGLSKTVQDNVTAPGLSTTQ